MAEVASGGPTGERARSRCARSERAATLRSMRTHDSARIVCTDTLRSLPSRNSPRDIRVPKEVFEQHSKPKELRHSTTCPSTRTVGSKQLERRPSHPLVAANIYVRDTSSVESGFLSSSTIICDHD
ncbi:hypothetical protein KSP40_PGU004951 [Platanthera guangdongensis]|uniref:Uncharacterized protein n=1 Tax=Platanthera guangdongensis TaxID=2320717 RepID=A0ABR2MKK9_9ASPA